MATQMLISGQYSSEDYQVANYGVGGHYGLHFDAFNFTSYVSSHRKQRYLLAGT